LLAFDMGFFLSLVLMAWARRVTRTARRAF